MCKWNVKGGKKSKERDVCLCFLTAVTEVPGIWSLGLMGPREPGGPLSSQLGVPRGQGAAQNWETLRNSRAPARGPAILTHRFRCCCASPSLLVAPGTARPQADHAGHCLARSRSWYYSAHVFLWLVLMGMPGFPAQMT